MSRRLRADVVGALLLGAVLSGAAVHHALPDAPVAEAARDGDVERVRALIVEGGDVNAALGDGMTALHWAAERGDAAMASLLLNAGASVHAGTRIGGYTPLHVAARAGSAEVARAILAAGGDVEATTTTTGVRPLHLAAESGDADLVRLLAEHGAEVDAREREWGHTPLFFAAGLNHVDAIRALVALGADPGATSDVIDVAERQAVDRAARERLEEVLRSFRRDTLAQRDWTPTPRQVQAAVQAAREVQQAGFAALEAAEGEDEDPEDEEEEEPREHPVGGWGGLTPLLHAARNGHREATFALLEAGADIDQASEGDGTSPLLIAAMNGHFDLAMELVRRGADPDLASDAGATPLYVAVNLQWSPKTRYPQPRAHEFQETTYLELMEALLEAGADPNVRLEKDLWYNWGGRDAWGATPFWRAAYGTDVEAMRLLVAYGADPHIPTKRPPERRRRSDDDEEEDEEELDPSGLPPVPEGGPGTWPLQAASGVGYGENYSEGNIHRHAAGGWLPAVRYLVDELGADVNSRDHNGYNAIHHAAARGDNELILYLVAKGGDVTAISREGQTTADMANSPGQRLPRYPETIALLEALGSENNQNCYIC